MVRNGSNQLEKLDSEVFGLAENESVLRIPKFKIPVMYSWFYKNGDHFGTATLDFGILTVDSFSATLST